MNRRAAISGVMDYAEGAEALSQTNIQGWFGVAQSVKPVPRDSPYSRYLHIYKSVSPREVNDWAF
jgi:hypothetical protein